MENPTTFFEASMKCIKLTAYMARRKTIVEILTKLTIFCDIAVFPMLLICFFLNKESMYSMAFIGVSLLVAIWAIIGKKITASYGISVLKYGLSMEHFFTLRDELLIESLEAIVIDGLNNNSVTIDEDTDDMFPKLNLVDPIPHDAFVKAVENVRKYTEDERQEKLKAVMPRVKREMILFKKSS